MNKKSTLLWRITGICLIMTVIFWFLMNKTEVKYEEVTAIVTSASSRVVVNKKNAKQNYIL